jgi:hypothetical protein
MSVYDALNQAMRNKDAAGYLALLDDNYEFVRHQSGTRMNKRDVGEMLKKMMASGSASVTDERCLYENADILVEHSVMSFPDGTREAVMGVHHLKGGKIVRTETGATLLKG